MNENKVTLDALQQEAVFSHFFAICRIPHNSHEEKNLSDAIWLGPKQKGWLSGRMNEITCSCGGKPHRMPVISQASLCRPTWIWSVKKAPHVFMILKKIRLSLK